MKIKLDENLSKIHVSILLEAGFEADRVFDQGLSGISDEDLWLHVCRSNQFLITVDKDFSDIRKYHRTPHPGLLLLRPKHQGAETVSIILRRVIKAYHLEELSGCLVVADERNTRIRKPSR